jgi:hypothetical protein
LEHFSFYGAFKAQIATLKDKLRFWEKLTPGEMSKHFGHLLVAVINKKTI